LSVPMLSSGLTPVRLLAIKPVASNEHSCMLVLILVMGQAQRQSELAATTSAATSAVPEAQSLCGCGTGQSKPPPPQSHQVQHTRVPLLPMSSDSNVIRCAGAGAASLPPKPTSPTYARAWQGPVHLTPYH
jgi:hypothetical protein